MSDTITVTIAPELDRVRILATTPTHDVLKAVLGPVRGAHPRAAATLLETASPANMIRIIETYRATICFTAPTAYSAMLDAVGRVSDLKLFNLEDIGPSYALTLRAWRERFLRRRDQVRSLGYPERLVRMWDYYLAYCEGGFIERATGDVQMLLTKPGARRSQFVPL